MRRVLLIHPLRKNLVSNTSHLGLAMLAGVLRKAGHQVMVLDYVLLNRVLQGRPPAVGEMIAEFQPDVVGVSLYTSTIEESRAMVAEVRKLGIPTVVGGPHATLNGPELVQQNVADYIVMGEAELSIENVVRSAQARSVPELVESPLPDPKALPEPDFTAFYRYEWIDVYPLLTSRGCPFGCSFCAVRQISSRKWRAKDPLACVNELSTAIQQLPKLQTVEVSDDCPTANVAHFKSFLKLYVEHEIGLKMRIANMRADSVDEELVSLVRAAGCDYLCIAAEHGHPEVFASINKGETLDDIRRAGTLISKAGLELQMCFIIGLPGDSLDKTKYSIALAKELRPKGIFWNMAHPFKGTPMREWYEANGTIIDDNVDYTSYVGDGFRLDEPIVETSDFTREERRKANYLAVVETGQYRLNANNVYRVLAFGAKYGYLPVAVRALLAKTFAAALNIVRPAPRPVELPAIKSSRSNGES